MRWLGNVLATGTFALIVIGLVISAVVATPLARRLQVDRLRLFLCLAATSLIVAVTWPLDSAAAFRLVGDSFDLGRLLTWWRQGWGSLIRDVLNDVDGQTNIMLFVPAGFLWTLTTKRPGRVFAALVLLSFLVESVQAVSGLRAADPRDLVANGAGAAIGVLIAVAWMAVQRAFRRADPDDVSGERSSGGIRRPRQSAVASLLAALMVVLFVYQYVERKADQERDMLLVNLRGVFGDTTSADIAPLIGEGGDFERFMAMADVRPDSVRHIDETSIEARYTTEFGGAERCVFVTWGPSSSHFRPGAGSECTDFLG